jgi:hypothetical protein
MKPSFVEPLSSRSLASPPCPKGVLYDVSPIDPPVLTSQAAVDETQGLGASGDSTNAAYPTFPT